jgi:hypothetical protein
MSYSISRDFLYFLLWFIEAIKAPPFTFRVALYSLNLCKIVEYPSPKRYPISFKLPYSACLSD